jgi:hypothetical protein
MEIPIYVGSFSDDAFTLRRCQILLASSRGEHAPRIAHSLGCGQQFVPTGVRVVTLDLQNRQAAEKENGDGSVRGLWK